MCVIGPGKPNVCHSTCLCWRKSWKIIGLWYGVSAVSGYLHNMTYSRLRWISADMSLKLLVATIVIALWTTILSLYLASYHSFYLFDQHEHSQMLFCSSILLTTANLRTASWASVGVGVWRYVRIHSFKLCPISAHLETTLSEPLMPQARCDLRNYRLIT